MRNQITLGALLSALWLALPIFFDVFPPQGGGGGGGVSEGSDPSFGDVTVDSLILDSANADVGLARDSAGVAKVTDGSTGLGTLIVANGTQAANSLTFNGDPDTGVFRANTNTLGLSAAGLQLVVSNNSVVRVKSSGQFGFASTANALSGADTGLKRQAAGVVATTDGSTGDATALDLGSAEIRFGSAVGTPDAGMVRNAANAVSITDGAGGSPDGTLYLRDGQTGIASTANGQAIDFLRAATIQATITSSDLRLKQGIDLTFAAAGIADVGLARDSAGVVATTDGSTGDATALDLGSAALRFGSAVGTQVTYLQRSGGVLQVRDSGLSIGNNTYAVSEGDLACGPTGGDRMEYDQSTNDLSLFNASINPDVMLDPEGRGIFLGDGTSASGDVAFTRAEAGVAMVTANGDAPTFPGDAAPGAVRMSRDVEANTAVAASPNVLTSEEVNKLLTNEGATAENHHDLPSAVAGYTYTFLVQDADGIQINAATGDTIRLSSAVSASAGNIEATAIGSSVTLVAVNATEWIATEYTGTWTVN